SMRTLRGRVRCTGFASDPSQMSPSTTRSWNSFSAWASARPTWSQSNPLTEATRYLPTERQHALLFALLSPMHAIRYPTFTDRSPAGADCVTLSHCGKLFGAGTSGHRREKLHARRRQLRL